MRDASSVTWFREGDRVRVVVPIVVNGVDLEGAEGVCIDAWEKCEVDPHCCCAELAEESVAVTVRFPDNITYYFAEDELEQVRSTTPSAGAVAAAAMAGATSTAASAADYGDVVLLHPVSIEDKMIAVALVLPLISYQLAARANGQSLLPVLDFAILAAVLSAGLYLTR